MRFRIEVLPFIAAAAIAGAVVGAVVRLSGANSGCAWAAGLALATVFTVYFLYFFRDPERTPPGDPGAIVSAAEGRLASIMNLPADAFLAHCLKSGLKSDQLGGLAGHEVVRISVFLSPLNVHVNRAPMDGESRFLGYFPGKHWFTFQEKSSEENQHNAILIANDRTTCLLNQIVGPVCRRVVYWLSHEAPVAVRQGDPIGMMKFGSRLDLYFPRDDIELAARVNDRVRAGETVIARCRKGVGP
jgi:phosphatidylserine decarboxylase